MKIGDTRPVEVPIVRCTECGVSYALEVPLFQMGRSEPEWIYVARCKHKPKNMQIGVDEIEYARLNMSRICALAESPGAARHDRCL